MSQVVHHQVGMGIYPQSLPAEEFPQQVVEILRGFIDTAQKQWGATIDWSTFHAEAGDTVEVVAMDGSSSPLDRPIHFYVDAVEIREEKSDKPYRYPNGAQV